MSTPMNEATEKNQAPLSTPSIGESKGSDGSDEIVEWIEHLIREATPGNAGHLLYQRSDEIIAALRLSQKANLPDGSDEIVEALKEVIQWTEDFPSDEVRIDLKLAKLILFHLSQKANLPDGSVRNAALEEAALKVDYYFCDLLETLQEGLMTDGGLTRDDKVGMRNQARLCEVAREELPPRIRALKSVRQNDQGFSGASSVEGHTPTPWRIAGKASGYIVAPDGPDGKSIIQVAMVGNYGDEELLPFNRARWDADCRLIVAAVNAYTEKQNPNPVKSETQND